MRNSIEKKSSRLSWSTRRLEVHPDISETELPKWRQMTRWVKELPENIQSTLDDFLYERRETSPIKELKYYEAVLEHEFKLPKDPVSKLSPSKNPKYEKFLLTPTQDTDQALDSENTQPQRALIFVPHADDIAFSMGAFMTDLKNKYGKKIAFDFVIATDGSAGFSPEKQKQYSQADRQKIRQYEQIREALELGANSISFLHYPDSELSKQTADAERDVIREIQLTQPTYVFSYAPRYERKNPKNNILSTNIEHIDHLASGNIIENAIKKSGMRASVPKQKISLRQPHRPTYWFQFGYDKNVSQQTNFSYQPTATTFTRKLSAFAMNKSQTMMNWNLSPELNGLHYLMRVNREVDKNNQNVSENFVVQEITRMAV